MNKSKDSNKDKKDTSDQKEVSIFDKIEQEYEQAKQRFLKSIKDEEQSKKS